MTILCIGSINWDRVFRVAAFPQPGETLTASGVEVGLGGKGLNHSIAIHRSGGQIRHLGAIARDDTAMQDRIAALGLATDLVIPIDGYQTGSAFILVDDVGENLIVLDPGTNRQIPVSAMSSAIGEMVAGQDWLLMQNETNGLAEATAEAKARGVRVALAAAPFKAEDVIPVIANLGLLAVNEVEYGQLCEAIGGSDALPHDLTLFVSRGGEGAELRTPERAYRVPAHKVEPVDTTGAGDTAFGAFLARTDLGEAPEQALAYAMAAGALQVTRPGAAEVIPQEDEVLTFIKDAAQ